VAQSTRHPFTSPGRRPFVIRIDQGQVPGQSPPQLLRRDLDVAGLKARVLGRIEEREARESEREELHSELVPAMQTNGRSEFFTY
jgi:hypothetical protein